MDDRLKMKKNLPVTCQEILFPQGRLLLSRTDLKGVITEANDEFIRLSGFSEQELIGRSHNLVRHPDMPEQAFADLWQTIRRGKPWRGLVKNRCKNGDFYWVDAFVVPVMKGGQIVEYMSVRSEPDREQIAAAEVRYAELNQSGKPVDGNYRLSRLWNVRTRLAASMSVSVLMVILTALIGLHGMRDSDRALDAAYQRDFEPAQQLSLSLQKMDAALKYVVLGADAASAEARMLFSRQATEEISALEVLRQQLLASPLNQDGHGLLAEFEAAQTAYIEQGLRPSIARIKEADLVRENAVTRIEPLYQIARQQAKKLEIDLIKQAGSRRQEAAENYKSMVSISVAGVLVSLLVMFAASQLQARLILVQIRNAINSCNRIGEGIMTDDYDLDRQDEFGELNCALAIMQTRIRVLIDEIRQASMALQQHSANLAAQMYMVVRQSEIQTQRIQEAAHSAELSSQSVKGVVELASTMSHSAHSSKVLLAQSNDAMTQSMSANRKVVDAVRASGDVMRHLSLRIDGISQITVSIKKISEQTKLLALNAAIESARAGESGRGFAVVADEVHKLSMRTGQSTLDINAMVSEIRAVADDAIRVMELAEGEVHAGAGSMHHGVDGLAQVSVSGGLVVSHSRQISDLAEVQAQLSSQIAVDMMQISVLVEQNTLLAKDASKLSDDLHQTSEVMRKAIDAFELVRQKTINQSSGSNIPGEAEFF